MKKHLSWMVVLGFLTPVLVSCAAPETAATEEAPVRVEVSLTDFKVDASTTSFRAGKTYEFVITNEGALEHEFRILPPADESENEGMDMHGDEIHDTALLVVEASELQPGDSVTIEYTFPDDAAEEHLEIACHTPGHYEAGMKTPITVSD